MARFTLENAPGFDAAGVEVLNARFEQAVRGIDPEAAYKAGRALDAGFFDWLAQVILEDAQTQRKVSEAFTTYQAKGNRESLS